MASKNDDNPAPTTETDVRLFLSRKSPDALNRWLAEADSDSANAMLYEIAKSARRPSYALFMMGGLFVFLLILFLLIQTTSHPYPRLSELVLAFTSPIFLWHWPNIGVKAAVVLVERDAKQSLLSMARLWSPCDKKPLLTAEGEANLERRLAAEHKYADPDLIKFLRGMVIRAFPWRLRRSERDFTDIQADILLAALRCVAKAGGDDNKKILRRIARFPVPAKAANRALIQAITQTFLAPENPVIVPPVIVLPVSVVIRETPAPTTVTLRRP